MDFIKQNFMLIGLALVSGAALLWPMLRIGSSGVKEVSPNDAVLLINRENAVVLDVRSATEFAGGHVTASINVPLDALESRLGELAKYKEKPLLVNCQSGMRSTSACSVLKKAGFTRIYYLDGGMNAWAQAKLPVVKEA